MNDLLPHLKTEEKLLLLLCRLEFSGKERAEIMELINETADWDRFVKLVNEHGVIALSAYNIRQPGLTEMVPPGTMKTLDSARIQSIMRNSWLVQRWKEVNVILTDAGIKHVLLKGMALEHTVYGSHGVRQMTDTDILVKKEDVLKSWMLLQEHGFQPDMIKSPLHRKIITEIGKHMPTLRKDGFPLEIHHRLFYEPDRNDILGEAIDNAIEIDVEGTRAFILHDDIHLEFLRKHHEDHMASGGSQLRLWLDMELLSPGSAPPLTEGFLSRPEKSGSAKQRREYYRIHYFALSRGVRFRYLAGDIFPSLRWMRKRHGCGSVKALFLYPRRLGKVLWVLTA